MMLAYICNLKLTFKENKWKIANMKKYILSIFSTKTNPYSFFKISLSLYVLRAMQVKNKYILFKSFCIFLSLVLLKLYNVIHSSLLFISQRYVLFCKLYFGHSGDESLILIFSRIVLELFSNDSIMNKYKST